MDLRSSAVFCQASLCGLSEAAGRFSDCGPVKRKATDPSGVMVLFEVTRYCASAWHSVVVVSNVWIGLCRMLRIPSARARSTSLRPFGTLLPATGAGIQVRLWPPFST